jgi:hypothetical protein
MPNRRTVVAALLLVLAAVPAAAADWKPARFDRITVEVPATCSLVARSSSTADCTYAIPGATRRILIRARTDAFKPADTSWLRKQQPSGRQTFLETRYSDLAKREFGMGPDLSGRVGQGDRISRQTLRPDPGTTPDWADVCTLRKFEQRPRRSGADATDKRYLGCGRFTPDFTSAFEVIVIVEDVGPGVPVGQAAVDIATTSTRIFRSLALDR